ncbi:hypothetical protein ACQ4LE_000041 [Meloidogyne hapla]
MLRDNNLRLEFNRLKNEINEIQNKIHENQLAQIRYKDLCFLNQRKRDDSPFSNKNFTHELQKKIVEQSETYKKIIEIYNQMAPLQSQIHAQPGGNIIASHQGNFSGQTSTVRHPHSSLGTHQQGGIHHEGGSSRLDFGGSSSTQVHSFGNLVGGHQPGNYPGQTSTVSHPNSSLVSHQHVTADSGYSGLNSGGGTSTQGHNFDDNRRRLDRNLTFDELPAPPRVTYEEHKFIEDTDKDEDNQNDNQ